MIGIDIRYLKRDMEDGIISSGVGLFCAEVLGGMKEEDREKTALIINPEQREVTEKLFHGFNVLVFHSLYTEKYNDHDRIIDERNFARFLEENEIRCLWVPFATRGRYSHVRIPVISTIHDIIPVHNNPTEIKWKDRFRGVLEESQEIITVSEYVRRDILREFEDTDIKNIRVIPCPVTVNTEETKEVTELRGRDYILDVNAYQKRKNAVTLLRAYVLSGLFDRCDLVFCGGYTEKDVLEGLKDTAAKLGVQEQVHFYLKIPMEERNWLLKHARMMVSPSLREGFGRTPVEAAISGIPVLTTTVDSLEEVTLGMLNYYREPQNAEQLSEALKALYENPPAPEELQRIADVLKEKYDPERIAGMYRKVFEQYNRE